LSIKYGIPLEEGNYVSAKEAVLWQREDNQAFSTRVTGIGRDDVFGLYQKQSTSAIHTTGLLTIGVGSIAPTNGENTGKINNGDFLLWGDNGGALLTQPTQDALLALMNRQWLVKPSGATVQSLPLELAVDFSLLPVDSLGYWLVIDRSGKGDFSPTTLSTSCLIPSPKTGWPTSATYILTPTFRGATVLPSYGLSPCWPSPIR
jgi:hypothetical protein